MFESIRKVNKLGWVSILLMRIFAGGNMLTSAKARIGGEMLRGGVVEI